MNIKRKGIYKILIILTTIVCLLNGCIRLFNTFADTVQGSTSAGSPEEFMAEYGESNSYLWFKKIDTETDKVRVYKHSFVKLPDDLEYSELNGVITFTTKNRTYNRGYRYTFSDGSYSQSYTSNSDTRNYSVNVEDRVVNDYDVEQVILCINGTIYDSNALNVEVSFSPALVGVVDREIDNNGVKSYMSELKMTVINHCSYPVQYKMDITAKNQTNSRPSGSTDYTTYYDDDPVFKFYSEDWVWNKSGLAADSSDSNDLGNIWSDVPFKMEKGSEWHYLGSRLTKNQTFKFSQINLRQGVEYTVTVYACPSLNDYATENFTSNISDINDYTLDSSTIEVVYQSDFSMLQYDDVVYNPNDDSNGVLPFNGYDGSAPSEKYDKSYKAWESLDGNVSYQNKDGLPSYHTYGSGGSNYVALDGNYNNLIAKTSGVYIFISAVLSYFPTDIFIVLNIALWSIVIIVIIRRIK